MIGNIISGRTRVLHDLAYSRYVLVGTIEKLYKIQGYSIIKAIINGNKTVQQNDIN